jgi:uncharacterized protein with von Willebrand factor type A (vWA) domain
MTANEPERRGFLRAIDRAAFGVALTERLRDGGVPVDLTAAEGFVRALAALPPDSRSRLYWTARVNLVRKQSELGAFDAVFAAVFDDAVLAVDPNARRKAVKRAFGEDHSLASTGANSAPQEAGIGLPWLTLPPVVADAEDSESGTTVPELLPSELAALADAPFDELSDSDMDRLGHWLESAIRDWPMRRSRPA